MNYQLALTHLCSAIEGLPDCGKVASYIPELGNVDPDKFGVHVQTLSGEQASYGDFNEKFSIQSIAKVLSLVMAYQHLEEDLWTRVGVEPSGDPFNSLVQLEYEHGIPRNPLINAGAIVVCDVLISALGNPKNELLHFIRSLSGLSDVDI